jgi:electron transport complex protein RnfC
MLKKSFFGLVKPRLQYESLTGRLPEPKIIPEPARVTLMIEGSFETRDAGLFKQGDSVAAGQQLRHTEAGGAYAVATVAGTVAAVSAYTGDYGKRYTAVEIRTGAVETTAPPSVDFASLPTLETAADRLLCLPGAPNLDLFKAAETPIHTLVIYGGDNDLLITTNQYVVRARLDAIKAGIKLIKSITGLDKVVIAIPGELVQGYGHIGADIRNVDLTYPSASPKMIMQKVLGQTVPAGRTCEDLGVGFITAEAVASLGEVALTGSYPTRKLLTVINKAEQPVLVSAVVGTPIDDIFQSLGITLADGDRIIVGGPMTGSAIYSTDYPVMPHTSALMVQDKNAIPYVSDYPCINCGECIPVCPTRVPVNMLVRFLEAGKYEDAADLYDLYACIDCGLCAMVCPSKIPIFQYISLAKFELERMKSAEAVNE